MLGFLLFVPPLLPLFDAGSMVLGVPLLWVYLFVRLGGRRRPGRRRPRHARPGVAPVLQTWVLVAVSAAYLGLLFAVAFYGDRRRATPGAA